MTTNLSPGGPPPALPTPGFRINSRVAARILVFLAIICPCVIVTDWLSQRDRHPIDEAAATTASHPHASASATSLPGVSR